jgi:hypothetical protein
MGTNDILGVQLPDSRLAREITQYVRDTENDLLFRHAARVCWWGALSGKKLGLASASAIPWPRRTSRAAFAPSASKRSRLPC